MPEKFKNKYKIESPRLSGYDYSQNGMYFVTICTKGRIEYFGEIKNGEMVLNDCGKITEKRLLWLPKNFNYIGIDCHIIMPNHIHLVLEIHNDVGTGRDLSLPIKIKSLSELIGAFKTTSSKFIHGTEPEFQWQRSFYDHIIRNEISLNKIREYIQTNPAMWEKDRNNIENLWM